ncbi:MAG: M23 family metallopeptidase [Planctomycetota bacterium]|nr:MAG: M23 family metallopeptidase [Planctomycetota bacterium]
MPRGGRINILVVHDQAGKSYQWSISPLLLRILLWAAVLVCIMALSAIILTWLLISKSDRIGELTTENMRLTVYSMEISQLREELNYHRRFTRRLCGMMGIDFPDTPAVSTDELTATQLPEMAGDSMMPVSGPPDPLLSAVATAPLPSELSPHPNNYPIGVPMRGRPSRGFSPDQANVSLRHFGLDIAGREGSPVFVTAAGIVKFAGWDDALGNLMIVDHENGYETVYGHNNAMMFDQGDRVNFGDIIALSGNSGISSAPHLHYEIRLDAQPIDPVQLIRPDSLRVAVENGTSR